MQIERVREVCNPEHQHVTVDRTGREHLVEDRLHQQNAKGRHCAHNCHQRNRDKSLQQIGPKIPEQAPDLPHIATVPAAPPRLAILVL